MTFTSRPSFHEHHFYVSYRTYLQCDVSLVVAQLGLKE